MYLEGLSRQRKHAGCRDCVLPSWRPAWGLSGRPPSPSLPSRPVRSALALSFCPRAAATPRRPPLGRPSFRANAHMVRKRCTKGPSLEHAITRRRAFVISRLGKSPQTPGRGKLGGCGADNAATKRERTMATTIGFVIGVCICDSMAVGRDRRHWKTNTMELFASSTATLKSQLQGRQTRDRAKASMTCSSKNLGSAMARSTTHKNGAKTTDRKIQIGWTMNVQQNEALLSPFRSLAGPNALCTVCVRVESTHVEFATPISMLLTEERSLSSPELREELPPTAPAPWAEGPNWTKQR
mmetsp:Transcript_100009/g.282333  ORF Transcript_100009/g.282333 Transcript_100009/m.282333 type:complete len:297 (+) Transcript_100009:260-1150(+)